MFLWPLGLTGPCGIKYRIIPPAAELNRVLTSGNPDTLNTDYIKNYFETIVLHDLRCHSNVQLGCICNV